MPKIKDIVPEYQSYLDLGMSHDEIKNIAKSRVKLKGTKKVSNDTKKIPKKQSYRDYLKTSDDIVPQISRGLASNFIRTTSALKGLTGISVPKQDQLVKLGEELNSAKEKIGSSGITQQRAQEKQQLAKESQSAKGFVGNAKAGVEQMYDSMTHPSEWTVQGATEFASDPLNALGVGVGRIVTKGILSPFVRAVAGGAATGVENAALSSGSAYLTARGEGKSVEEAKKIAMQAAGGGAVAGVAMGGVGGAMPRAKAKGVPEPEIKDFNSKQNMADMDSAFKGLGEDTKPADPPNRANGLKIEHEQKSIDEQGADNLFNILESEHQAHNEDALTKQKSAELIQSGVTDPQIIKARVESVIKPSETDLLITKALNGDNPLPPGWTGARILSKMENTIKSKLDDPQNARSVEELFARLKEYGASDELASVASEAYAKGDMKIFSDWYAKKIKESMSAEAQSIKKVSNDTEKIPKTLKDGKLIDDVTGVKEDVSYKVLPKEQVKTNFKAGDGYQFRSDKQDKVISDIRDNFDADRHFGSDGGFDGVPVVDSKGNVLIGNHRAEAIKNMSDEQFAAYQQKMKEKYPKAGDGMMVRVLKDDKNAKEIAKVSNDRRVKKDSEKLILDGAKYKKKIAALPEKIESEVALKNHLGASDELESNRAVLANLTSDRLPYAVDRYMKDNPLDLNFKQMFYKNAYRLYNVSKLAKKDGYGMLDITSLLDRSIDKITKSKSNKKANLNGIIEHYNEAMKSGGKDIEGKVISSKEFAADILGVALKHYKSLKDDGIAEFGKRLDDAVEFVKEQKQPNLFGEEKKEPTLSDVALTFLNESDRNRLDLLDLKERIEKNEDTQRGDGRGNTSPKGADTTDTGNADGKTGISARGDKGVSDDSTATKRSAKDTASKDTADTSKQSDAGSKSTTHLDDSSTGSKHPAGVKLTTKDIDTILKTGEKKVVEKVSPEEAKTLNKEFDFKHPENITRTIDKSQINHVLKSHGDPKKEASRGNVAVTKEDIANYLDIVKDYDLKVKRVTSGGKPAIVYGKQINGYHMVVEEVRTGKSDLAFFTMRKTKGRLSEDALMRASQRPRALRPETTSSYDESIAKTDKNINNDIKTVSKDTKKVSKTVEKLEKEGKISTLLYKDIAQIKKNTRAKKLELKFDERLDEPTKRLLKKNGYSYNRKKRVWESGLNKKSTSKVESLIKEIKGMRIDKENC